MNTNVISPLYLPAELWRRMTEDAVRAYPDECCGILFGRDVLPLPRGERAGVRGVTSSTGLTRATALPPHPNPLPSGERERRRIVERVQPADNVATPGERFARFAIEPLVLMRAEREAADAGRAVVGFYHSHPDHPARPSAHDREHAWPVYSYVIISVQQGEAVDVTSWVLDDEMRAFQRQDIVEAIE
jgi:proteasome lid subunit RPN8/RPN11